MVKNRLIFTLLMQNGTYMLSRNFRLQSVGNLDWIKEYYDFNAIAYSIDELIVLNVERGEKTVNGFAGNVAELVAGCFIPIACGGGIRSLDDAFTLLDAGADKLVVNTPLVKQPDLVREMVKNFGSQCVVASIDYRRVGDRTMVYIADGTEETGWTVEDAVANAERLEAGEIYLTSMERDGTGQGYDLEMLTQITASSSLPVIASGGVGRYDHLTTGIEKAGVKAVSTANLFNFMAEGLTEARDYMKDREIDLAVWQMGWTPTYTAIFVPARLGSSRLPEKMMADICGQPALWYPLDGMTKATLPDLKVVCTSTNAEDDRIAEYAESQSWLVFRGDEEDVLKRYLDAASLFEIEFFVNVDGDDLFCAADYVDRIIERFLETDADYICCEGLPFGGAPIGVRVSALRDVCARKGEADTQGWGKYFVQSGLYKVETISADPSVRRPDYRMTLDYPEDLEFFRRTVQAIDPEHLSFLTMTEIVAFLDDHPEVVAVSQRVSEEYWARFNREHGTFTLTESHPGVTS